MHEMAVLLVCLALFANGQHVPARRVHTRNVGDVQDPYEVIDAFRLRAPTVEVKRSNEKSNALVSFLLAFTPSCRGVATPARVATRHAVAPQMKPTPMVPFNPPGSGVQYTQWISVYQRMARERIITLFGYLDDNAANQYIAMLFYLQNEDPKKKVTLYVNLAGGDISAGLALFDTMSTMPFDIETFNLGFSGDLGAFIVAGGTKGMRYAMQSSRFRLSGPRMYPPMDEDGKPQQIPMQAADIAIEVTQVLLEKRKVLEAFSKFSGQPVSKLEQDFQRDFYLDAKGAKEYGLVDGILTVE